MLYFCPHINLLVPPFLDTTCISPRLYKRFKQIELARFLGVLEAMNAGVGKTIKLVLQRRKGWIKLALRYGVDLVPTFSFGEHSIYEQKENPEGENDY